MNRFKFFILTNCLFHVCFLFTCPLLCMADIVGAVPIFVYSVILTIAVKDTDTYNKLFFKGLLTFLPLAVALTLMSDLILVGMILSILGIVLALSLQPLLLRYCK